MLSGISIAASLALGVLAQGQTTPIAITHARIIDSRGGAVIPDGNIIVNGTRSDSVGSAASISVPPGARIIDGTGKTVIPGLADMHVHLTGGWDGETTDILGYQRYLNGLLYAGVTTILDTGNVQPFILQVRQEVASGRLLGPRIYCAGALIDGPDAIWPDISFSVASVSQVPAIVAHQKSAGVDVIRAYFGLSVPIVSRLASEGRKSGL